MRVSVIVPLYNKRAYLRRALDSIASQSFTDFEVIIVDDGSTDGGGELAATYLDSRFRVVRQPNTGPGAARNRGITEACGDLIAFLDADDSWSAEYLAYCVSLLDCHTPRVASVSCGYLDYPPGISTESMWRKRGLTEGFQRVAPGDSCQLLVYRLAYMSCCNTVVRTDVVRRWGGLYSQNGCRYAEDATLWLKILLNESVYFHLLPLANFYRDASALSGNLTGARPVEPFLSDPDHVAEVCPPELLPLLRGFYAFRACKTASVLGYWGESRKARALFRRFVSLSDWRMPFFAPALVGCTPVGGFLGRFWRSLASLHRTFPAQSL